MRDISRHKADEELIFLMGFQRSGTTWLQKMLAAHPDIGTAQESHIFTHLLGPAERAWRYCLRNEERLVGLPCYLAEREWKALSKRIVLEIVSHAEEYHRFKYFLEKTPDHLLFLDHIYELFPNSKYIMVIRNPYDVTESLLAASKSWARHWAPRTIKNAARVWNKYAKAFVEYGMRIPDSKRITIRYEDLTEDTLAELTRIVDFLGLTRSERIMETMLRGEEDLHKYGEFAIRDGTVVVQEPATFNRQKKGKISGLQRMMIRRRCHQYIAMLGY